MYFEPDMEQSDATVVQGVAPADRINRPFDEDETALQAPEDVKATAAPPPPPAPAPAVASQAEDLVQDIESWDFTDEPEEDEESQAHTIVPESLNDEEVEIETETTDTASAEPPEDKTEEPEQAAQEEPLIEKKKDGTFQPAKTMTPKEFERLFSEIDKDKNK
jgi:hypothetical protein